MRTLIVTRHQNAIDWLKAQFPRLTANAEIVAHLDRARIAEIEAGDVVVGVFPLDIAAEICAQGATLYAIILPQLAQGQRGQELTVQDMIEAGAHIQQFKIEAGPKMKGEI